MPTAPGSAIAHIGALAEGECWCIGRVVGMLLAKWVSVDAIWLKTAEASYTRAVSGKYPSL